MTDQVEKFIAPFKELNNIAVQNMEKLFEIQLKSFEENTRVGIEQMKNAAAISDLDSLKDYIASQTEVAKQVAERATQDSRAAIELGNTYNIEVQRIVKENFTLN